MLTLSCFFQLFSGEPGVVASQPPPIGTRYTGHCPKCSCDLRTILRTSGGSGAGPQDSEGSGGSGGSADATGSSGATGPISGIYSSK